MVELNENAGKDEQHTICEACGNSNLAHDRAVWTDDGTSFCPDCAALPALDGLVERLSYRVENPSAWDTFDQGGSDLIAEATTALQYKDERIERLKRMFEDCVDQYNSQLSRAEAAEQQVQKLTAENERLRGALVRSGVSLTMAGYSESASEVSHALETKEASNTPAATIRPEVKSEREILKRLAAGDEIAFSQDGDDAFFTQGDRAFVGRVILSMRSKGYLKRVVLDDENYRGLSERDVISDAGLAALETQEGGK